MRSKSVLGMNLLFHLCTFDLNLALTLFLWLLFFVLYNAAKMHTTVTELARRATGRNTNLFVSGIPHARQILNDCFGRG